MNYKKPIFVVEFLTLASLYSLSRVSEYEVRLNSGHVKTQLLLWLILVWETYHLESWLYGSVEKKQFLEVFVMQKYPWADKLSGATISTGLKAVKGSEVYKGK